MLLTQAVNGAVAAAIVGPVAIRSHSRPTQSALDGDGRRDGHSMAFITPLGHPVNVLVMSPGGYSFRDYVKVGLPLTVIFSSW